jgi:hypothetical protein
MTVPPDGCHLGRYVAEVAGMQAKRAAGDFDKDTPDLARIMITPDHELRSGTIYADGSTPIV